jgi:hypothetical protein
VLCARAALPPPAFETISDPINDVADIERLIGPARRSSEAAAFGGIGALHRQAMCAPHSSSL